MQRKIIKYIVVLLVIGGGIWYFIVKDYNYRITFTTTQSAGYVYDHLIRWNNGERLNNKVVSNINKMPFSKVEQELKVGDSVFNIRWILEKKNDSTTLVIAKIKDLKHSFKQNLQVPFYNNDFVKRSIKSVTKFGEGLLENAKNHKISKVTEDKIQSQYCAYISLESNSQNKASIMRNNIHIVMNYIKDNDIQLTGDPFLEITEWDYNKDIIKFDFCFPINERNIYPPTNTVKFKKTITKKALKTIFNGNYQISDRAWYSILDYAETHNIEVEKLPIEVYLNDPHSGGDPLEWEAEIYMPIKSQ